MNGQNQQMVSRQACAVGTAIGEEVPSQRQQVTGPKNLIFVSGKNGAIMHEYSFENLVKCTEPAPSMNSMNIVFARHCGLDARYDVENNPNRAFKFVKSSATSSRLVGKFNINMAIRLFKSSDHLAHDENAQI